MDKMVLKRRNLSSAFNMLVIATSVLAIIGWCLDMARLTQISMKFTNMKITTALCYIFLSLSILILHKNKRKRKVAFRIMVIAAASIALFPFAKVCMRLGAGPYITHILNMCLVTSICIIGICTGLFITTSKFKGLYKTAQYIFHTVTLISFISLLGHILKIPLLHSYYSINSMAIHSALALLILSVSASLVNPKLGITAMFTGNNLGNLMARRLSIRIVTAIVITSYIFIVSYRSNIVTIELGIALFAISFTVISLFFIYTTSNIVNEADINKEIATQNFRAVVESAPNALVISDMSGKISLVNNKARKIFGFEGNELIGSSLNVIVPERFRHAHNKKQPDYFRNPQPRNFDILHDLYAQKKDGTEFPVEIGITPIKTKEGTVALASIVDITERKCNEAIIKKQMLEQKQRNLEMEQFAYIASHDLQEPLRTVANYIGLLKEDYPEHITEEIGLHLDDMNSAVSRMSVW